MADVVDIPTHSVATVTIGTITRGLSNPSTVSHTTNKIIGLSEYPFWSVFPTAGEVTLNYDDREVIVIFSNSPAEA